MVGEKPRWAVRTAGDSALIIEFGQVITEEINTRVHDLYRAIVEAEWPEIEGLVPAYTTLLVEFDPRRIVVDELLERIENLPRPTAKPQARWFEVPVFYGGEWGEDLDEVAYRLHLTPQEVIREHANRPYRIYCLGFSPGFPLMGKLPRTLQVARRPSPRTRVPKGAVAVAEDQTGIYPVESPGGWNLIGRTPVTLWNPLRDPPVVYAPGDVIIFRPITHEEYVDLARRADRGETLIREVSHANHRDP